MSRDPLAVSVTGRAEEPCSERPEPNGSEDKGPCPVPARRVLPKTGPVALVLIVDDSVSNRDLVQTVMHYHGHDTVEYRGGAQALEGIRTQHPDVVLADVMMPDMDGYQLARAIHADPATSELPVIFYTANYQAPNAGPAAEAVGVYRIIPKTGDLTALLDAVESTLREAG